jgi:hypothetical protein
MYFYRVVQGPSKENRQKHQVWLILSKSSQKYQSPAINFTGSRLDNHDDIDTLAAGQAILQE